MSVFSCRAGDVTYHWIVQRVVASAGNNGLDTRPVRTDETSRITSTVSSQDSMQDGGDWWSASIQALRHDSEQTHVGYSKL